MALTNCRECGKMVSTEARACPHCGCPNPAGTRTTDAQRDYNNAFTVPNTGSFSRTVSNNRPPNPQDIRSIGTTVRGLLTAQIIIRIVGAFLGFLVALGLTQQVAASNNNFRSTETDWIGFSYFFLIINFIFFVISGILFLSWMYRAHKNLSYLRVKNTSYSPSWAVFGWFIPIAALFIPYLVMREIWQASDPRYSNDEWRRAPGTPLLGWWWGLWIFIAFFGFNIVPLGAFLPMWVAGVKSISVPETMMLALIAFSVDALVIVDAWLLQKIIHQISERQATKAERVLTEAA